ncbi:MAG: glutamine-synthetase adenylyltransferase, partial [Pseudomonadota bacterium]
AGVQTLSVLEANPTLIRHLVSLCAAAPRIARHLGERPALLEAMLRADFLTSPPDHQSHTATLASAITECRDLEQTLDAVRREAHEARHQIAVQALLGKISPERAGRAFADIAEASLRAVLPGVIDDVARRHGPPPGHGLAVLAMGKLGTREMTATSDLDLIMVYDPGEATQSIGARPLDPGRYYARLTRALTGAITVPTAEGALYEVDMRLRPSGRQGPVAVPFDGFKRYQLHEAWGWEHLALTRARVVAGPDPLCAQIASVLQAVRALPREAPAFLSELQDMRTRLAEAKGPAQAWDLKHGPGRLLDVDLFVQAGILLTGSGAPPDGHATEILRAEGWLTLSEADALGQTRRLLTATQSALRIIWGESGAPNPGDLATEAALARMTGHTSLESLQTAIEAQTALAAEIIAARVATV